VALNLKNFIKRVLRYIFKKKVVIPEYEEKRCIILGYKNKYNPLIFIETGTFMGDTIQSLLNEFKFLYSIELSEGLAHRAQERFKQHHSVKIINGSSDIELKGILKELTEPALFWLDGHYSGEFMYNDEFVKTAKGTLNTPVINELELILNSDLVHIILIDDARMFNGTEDYPTIRTLKNMVKKGRIKRKLLVKRDIIRILPASA
jgi:hypothetical protein